MGGQGSGRPEPAPRDSGGRYTGGGCFGVVLLVGLVTAMATAAIALMV
jgi:hypothetical protein